jgi:hypothetical protein
LKNPKAVGVGRDLVADGGTAVTQIQLTVADETMMFLRERAQDSGFTSPEAYLQNVLEEALRVADKRQLEAVLLERLDGPFIDMTDHEFRRLNEDIAADLSGNARP